MDKDAMIPEPDKGANKDFEYSKTAESKGTAKAIYAEAKRRLLSVAHWHALAGSMSADFMLTDSKGKEIDGPAYQGAYLRINIPGPGNMAGEGYDWVQVQQVKEDKDVYDDAERISLTLRPASPPDKDSTNDIAHFFDEEATSTFIIERNENVLNSYYHGRNEMPNTDTKSIIDKVRNTLVAWSAIFGFSDMQWKNLIQGFIDAPQP